MPFNKSLLLFYVYLALCSAVANENDNKVSNSYPESSSPNPKENSSSKKENLDNNVKHTDSPESISTQPTLSDGTANKSTLSVSVISGVPQNATGSFPAWMNPIKSGALQRTGFVALGFMLIVVSFFVIRGIRLRRKRSKSRKYGIITSTDMEMEPLDRDGDDEEDMTLFDAQQKYALH